MPLSFDMLVLFYASPMFRWLIVLGCQWLASFLYFFYVSCQCQVIPTERVVPLRPRLMCRGVRDAAVEEDLQYGLLVTIFCIGIGMSSVLIFEQHGRALSDIVAQQFTTTSRIAPCSHPSPPDLSNNPQLHPSSAAGRKHKQQSRLCLHPFPSSTHQSPQPDLPSQIS